MAHIHDLIDYAVSILIVHDNKVLFVHHKGLNIWLPIGGHIELNENPEQAAYHEAKEESGLDIELVGTKPVFPSLEHAEMLIPPRFMDFHPITPTHKHVGMIYFARAKSPNITHAEAEHHAIRWLSREDLASKEYNLLPNIKYYAEQALEELGSKAE
jgi:8-oxo-dGTP pyrophosphatase MutT (NUDIX family)